MSNHDMCGKCGDDYGDCSCGTADDSESAVNSLVMCPLLVHIYNSGYHAGHDDTVDGHYTDVMTVDMDSYHEDIVKKLVDELNHT